MDSLAESDELFAIGDDICGDEAIWVMLEIHMENHPNLFGFGPNS
jgi:hypothetical protein